MSLIDRFFRRDEGFAAAGPNSAAGAAATRSGSVRKRKSNSSLYRWAFVIHKWAGLIGAAWLAVLGLTGFFLNNDDWRSLQQVTTPHWLVSDSVSMNAARNVVRYLQIDPNDATRRLAAGPRGLWRSDDGGANWRATQFKDNAHPQVFAIEADPALGWKRLWIGTDMGLFATTDRGETAEIAGLAGERVTALAQGATPNEMLGVIDKSRVFRFDPELASRAEILDIAPLPDEARPLGVRLHRFVRSIHFGRGLFEEKTSRLLNDLGGLGMLILAMTGLLYWGFGKWWRVQAKAGVRGMSPEAKRATTSWLYRIHGATLGLIAAPVLLYLALTGIVVDHDQELGGLLRSISTPTALLTPAFRLNSWDRHIDAIVGYPDAPGTFSVGNFLGMFTTADDGKTWARESNADGQPIGGANRMRRIGDRVVIMSGMGSTAIIRGDDYAFHEAALAPADPGMGERMDRGSGREQGAGSGGMRPQGASPSARPMSMSMGAFSRGFAPSDVTAFEGGLLWRTSAKLVFTSLDGARLKMFEPTNPDSPGVPMFMWLRSIHTGALFWSEWRWVNDIFATFALFLIGTGLIRWWRQKWM
ncbi:PepSY domain-containing protein [Methylocystis sp. WRRC1]|uniref:PepSY-associated TM helix domain-containing protein n=1 Tax=Methylocystis sp. WRRC1 TaxID=1732014 RepID=UPI001D13341A|nr:PepSY-associated TM helix domain-containing protein [Methylocystis sp. WRRC1]MCC3243785.1 PepSY domain-containing protein [Methylocystis sp. WRRC1]